MLICVQQTRVQVLAMIEELPPATLTASNHLVEISYVLT